MTVIGLDIGKKTSYLKAIDDQGKTLRGGKSLDPPRRKTFGTSCSAFQDPSG